MHRLNHFKHLCIKFSTIIRMKNMVNNIEITKYILNSSMGPEKKWQTS